MTINYTIPVINDRLQATLTDIDASSPVPGGIRLLDSLGQTIGRVTLNLPCGTVSGGQLIFSTPAVAPVVLIDGQIVAATVENGAGTAIATGLTVGPSTAYDIYMANPSVTSGQIVTLTYASITGR